MTFVLGTKSRSNLQGVHPDLVRVVERAITLTTVDFQVFEGLRTASRQKQLVARGASQTMNSRHLVGADGFGHAVDLVPLKTVNGRGQLAWEWPLCYEVAKAVQQASQLEAVAIRWGGVWDMVLSNVGDPEHAVAEYTARRKAAGKSAFLDGPHFELPASLYP